MNVFVLIKEVPDMTKVKFDSEAGTVDRSSAEAEINPFDMNALQAGVNLKKQIDCQVTAVSMGPPRAEKSLRDAFARGVDQGVLLTDRKFGGSDTLATSSTLAAGIRAISNDLKDCDLILCGEKSVDGDTAQIGPEMAQALGIPHCCYVCEIREITSDSITVTVENICGHKQVRKMKLPALLSVTKNINYPEMPSVKRKLKSLSEPVRTMGIAELGDYLSEGDTGFAGSPTKVARIQVPKLLTKECRLFKKEGEFREAFLEVADGLL